jgi:hypothetical protein
MHAAIKGGSAERSPPAQVRLLHNGEHFCSVGAIAG